MSFIKEIDEALYGPIDEFITKKFQALTNDPAAKITFLLEVLAYLAYHVGTVEFLAVQYILEVVCKRDGLDWSTNSQVIKKLVEESRRYTNSRLASGRIQAASHFGASDDETLQEEYFSPYSMTNQAETHEEAALRLLTMIGPTETPN